MPEKWPASSDTNKAHQKVQSQSSVRRDRWHSVMQEVPICLPSVCQEEEDILFGQWLVDDGEEVLAGDRVAEVLSSGILVYVAAPVEGTLLQGNFRGGAVVSTTASLGIVLANDEDSLAG